MSPTVSDFRIHRSFYTSRITWIKQLVTVMVHPMFASCSYVSHNHVLFYCILGNAVSRYKQGAMQKLKMSNGGVADVYLSNSQCARNIDKPVDNSVFTGRLPVSAGPQRHQWQQQHQQLLMQTDDNVEFFVESGRAV